MQIGFLDPGTIEYNPLSPTIKPLGGIESAICYLSIALAKDGHNVHLLSKSSVEGNFGGVSCLSAYSVSSEFLNKLDVIICSVPIAKSLRGAGVIVPLILWTGHDANQAALGPLSDNEERSLWAHTIALSNWQRQKFIDTFKFEDDKITVINYGISTAFNGIRERDNYYFEENRAPILIYTSTPFRGLSVLLKAFPFIREKYPEVKARIFSSLKVYGVPDTEDQFSDLYKICQATPGIEYYGSVDQVQLRNAIVNSDIFAYPSIFPETGCISLMEAMAGGCLAVFNDLGVLSETSGGFGYAYKSHFDVSSVDFFQGYADFVNKVIEESYNNKIEYKNKMQLQKEYINHKHSWARISREWIEVIKKII